VTSSDPCYHPGCFPDGCCTGPVDIGDTGQQGLGSDLVGGGIGVPRRLIALGARAPGNNLGCLVCDW